MQWLPRLAFNISLSVDALVLLRIGQSSFGLDEASEIALARAAALAMNITDPYATKFVELSNVTNSTVSLDVRKRLLRKKNANVDSVVVLSEVPVSALAIVSADVDSLYFGSDDNPSAVFARITALVNRSTMSGEFTAALRMQSLILGALASSEASVLSVSLQPFTVQLPPTPRPTISPSLSPTVSPTEGPSKFWSLGTIIGVALGGVAACILCISCVVFFGWYGPKERVVAEMVDHRNLNF
jgi:hypothetical protein